MPYKLSFLIHDNGGRPFKVNITVRYKESDFVEIYKQMEDDCDSYYSVPFLTFNAKKIFIGESPINRTTKFSGEYGEKFYGNSILIQIDNDIGNSSNKYVFIGYEICEFETKSKIINFVSPVGNNDVPYPYAIDKEGYYYLLMDNVKLKIPDKYDEMDPYNYYYSAQSMTLTSNNFPTPIFPSDIKHFYIDNQIYHMNWHPNYKNEFLRLKNFNENGNSVIKVIYKNGLDVILDEATYIGILSEFNTHLNAEELITNILQERL